MLPPRSQDEYGQIFATGAARNNEHHRPAAGLQVVAIDPKPLTRLSDR